MFMFITLDGTFKKCKTAKPKNVQTAQDMQVCSHYSALPESGYLFYYF